MKEDNVHIESELNVILVESILNDYVFLHFEEQ